MALGASSSSYNIPQLVQKWNIESGVKSHGGVELDKTSVNQTVSDAAREAQRAERTARTARLYYEIAFDEVQRLKLLVGVMKELN